MPVTVPAHPHMHVVTATQRPDADVSRCGDAGDRSAVCGSDAHRNTRARLSEHVRAQSKQRAGCLFVCDLSTGETTSRKLGGFDDLGVGAAHPSSVATRTDAHRARCSNSGIGRAGAACGERPFVLSG